jgi:hypothetical protein
VAGSGIWRSAFRCSSTREHVGTYRAPVGTRGGEVALGAIREIIAGLIRSELADSAGRKSGDAMPRELLVDMIAAACMTALTWYLESGAEMPPDRMDAMFRRMIAEGLLRG